HSLSPLFARSTKRGLLGAVVASAMLALPAAAGAAPAGGSAQAVTQNPDVVSSALTPNAVLTSNVCYDTPVQAPSTAVLIPGGGGSWTGPGGIVPGFHLRGYSSAL